MSGSPDARSGSSRSRVRPLVGVVLALLVTGALVALRFRPVPVVAAPIVRGKAIDAIYATGTVEAEERVQIKAKTSGSIAEIYVKEGAVVHKGDLLARIDNPAVTFDLKRGKAELNARSAQAASDAPQIAALKASARALDADLGTARKDLDRTRSLVDGGSIARTELERVEARVAQLEAQIAANAAQQRALRIDLDAGAAQAAAQVASLAARVTDTEVRAPIDGVVLAKSIELGEVVQINQTLFKVGDTRSLILEVAIDEADVARVRDGAQGSVAAISLYAFPRQIFPGKVYEVLPDADRSRKTFLAKIRFDKPPEGLRSGMSAEVNIVADAHDNALLAPSEADLGGAVLRIEDGRARRVPITTGIRDLLRLEVSAGLSEGDLVVIEGQDKVEDGRRVTVTVKKPDPLAPMPDKTQPAGAASR
jgi:multidrug efflux pump subunit AcrA (membrane-fusion protein)